MKDLQAILAACRQADAANRPLALATVVKVEGSAYRRPGARMLVHMDGSRIGSISGGCLEADVVARARKAMETGEATAALYDVRSANGDIVVELGCKGAVTILIEPLTAAVRDSLEFLARAHRERRSGIMATVFRTTGEGSPPPGDRRMGLAQEKPFGSWQGANLPGWQECLETVQQEGKALVRTFPLAETAGEVDVLFEPIHPPIALVLCGAGQDALPVAQMAHLLGWQVSVLDHRETLLTPDRFPGVDTLLPSDRRTEIPLDARTAVVVMTHSYSHDLAWLRFLLPSPARYIGLLGPRKRALELQQHLAEDGMALTEAERQRLHSPVGLNLGAETSEEIALAILAEIQAVFQERSAGFLRAHSGPIHATTLSEPEGDFRSPDPRAACPVLG